MALGLGCLVKDTRIVEVISDILEAQAAANIVAGLPFSFMNAYHGLVKDGIEIDLESIAAIYTDVFDTNDEFFTPNDSIERIVGRKFEDALDKISSIRPFTGVKKISTLSPGKAAANQIALLFDRGMKLDEGTSSTMRVFQEKMKTAAEYYLDKTVFPSEGDKALRIQQIEKILESGNLGASTERKYKTILKRLKGKANFQEILDEALEFQSSGYERVDGGMNTINDVLDEFKIEIENYINGLIDKYNQEDNSDRKAELFVAIQSFKKYTDTIMNKVLELYMSESEINSVVKQTLINQGFGRRINDKKGKLKREVEKLNKLLDKERDPITITEINDKITVLQANIDSIENAEQELLRAEKEARDLDPLIPDYDLVLEKINERIFKYKNYLDNEQMALDWKKITFINDIVYDDAGNVVDEGINALKYHVQKALENAGFYPDNIVTIQKALETEYYRLRKDVAEKKLSELIRKNQAYPIQGSNTETRRLAKLYSYGWYDENYDRYEKIVRDALGVNTIDAETFDKLKKLSRDVYIIYEQRQNDEFTKTALNDIGQQIGDILQRYARDQNMFFKIASYIHDILSMAMRAMLTSISNYTQNTISGLSAVFTEKLVRRQEGLRNELTFQEGYDPRGDKDFKDMQTFLKEMSAAVFEDITYNGGVSYGDLSSTFMYRGGLDRIIDRIQNPRIHAAATFLSGRMFLDAMDSRYKFNLTHTYFVSNMAKILESQYGFSKEDALKEISSKLYGYSFEKAMDNARVLIDKINAQKDPDEKPFRKDDAMVMRMANDLVKMNLLDIDSRVEGKNISEETILLAYNAAYDASGYRIGHVPNNPLSKMVQGLNSHIGDRLESELKYGNYYSAAAWKIMQALNMAFLNPFGNGGTNWVVIALELTGGGILRVLPYYIGKKMFNSVKPYDDFDITNPDDIRQFERVMLEDRKNKIMLARGVVGGVTTALLSLLVYASIPGDDDEEKMKNFNQFYEDYKGNLKYVSWLPLSHLYIYNFVQNRNIDYLMRILNLRFQDFETTALVTQALKEYRDGNDGYAMGKIGELVGKFFTAPLPSYRVLKQLLDLAYQASGAEGASPFEMNEYSRSVGFWHGFTKFGVISDVGLRADAYYDLSSLPGTGEATMETLKSLNIKNTDQLIQYLVQQYPDLTLSEALKAMKKKNSNGKDVAMFNKKNIAYIEEIINNGNKMPSITLKTVFPDEDKRKLIEKKGIYTIPQLADAINNNDFFNSEDIQLTDKEREKILKQIENYYNQLEK